MPSGLLSFYELSLDNRKVENRAAVEAGVKLTRRGQQVAELVALGLSNKEIAQRIFLSERTVEWHVEQILNRLGFSSRTEIAAWVGRTQSGAPVRAPGRKRRGNLPAPLTSFVGRDDEMAELRGMITTNRLLTIVGAGGTGKTRLALRLAEELEPTFPDSVWLCDLAPVADPALVADAVAQALGTSKGTEDRLAEVRDHLSERVALLVLDNCEHLITSASDLASDLLGACRGLQILTTSLAPLGILGEAVLQLDPLPNDDAIRLFVERARAAAPAFNMNDATQVAVAAICDQLDRLPLALELAASRLRTLSLDELADAVSNAAPKRRGDRHGSLAALAAWGYETLDDDERALFRRLGAFAGWFERDDAAAIAIEGTAVPELLADLVEKSMVVAGRTSEGRARYRILETLRAFARRRLRDAGESEAVQLAHAERMVWLVERLGLRTEESEPGLWIKAEAMVDDVRAALTALIEVRPRRAAWMAGTLRWFWRSTGRLAEGVRWNAMVLEACPDACLERCWAVHGHVLTLLRMGRLDEARPWFLEALRLSALPESSRERGELLLVQALIYGGLGDVAAAEAAQRASIAALSSQGRTERATMIMSDLATTLLRQGRAEEAHEMAERCVRELRRMNSARIQFALDTLAQADCYVGKFDEARDVWFEAISRYLSTHEVIGLATCLEGLAYAAGVRGRTEAALRLHSCADHHFGLIADSYLAEPLQPRLFELVRRIEEQLGPQEAARLLAEGEALTLEEAVELARAQG